MKFFKAHVIRGCCGKKYGIVNQEGKRLSDIICLTCKGIIRENAYKREPIIPCGYVCIKNDYSCNHTLGFLIEPSDEYCTCLFCKRIDTYTERLDKKVSSLILYAVS